MKKLTGVVLAMVLMGAFLSGCYTHTCEPVSYKGEMTH